MKADGRALEWHKRRHSQDGPEMRISIAIALVSLCIAGGLRAQAPEDSGTDSGSPTQMQTLNPSNFGCAVKEAQRCFFEQDGKSDLDRNGKSVADYCAEKAMEECP